MASRTVLFTVLIASASAMNMEITASGGTLIRSSKTESGAATEDVASSNSLLGQEALPPCYTRGECVYEHEVAQLVCAEEKTRCPDREEDTPIVGPCSHWAQYCQQAKDAYETCPCEKRRRKENEWLAQQMKEELKKQEGRRAHPMPPASNSLLEQEALPPCYTRGECVYEHEVAQLVCAEEKTRCPDREEDTPIVGPCSHWAQYCQQAKDAYETCPCEKRRRKENEWLAQQMKEELKKQEGRRVPPMPPVR